MGDDGLVEVVGTPSVVYYGRKLPAHILRHLPPVLFRYGVLADLYLLSGKFLLEDLAVHVDGVKRGRYGEKPSVAVGDGSSLRNIYSIHLFIYTIDTVF